MTLQLSAAAIVKLPPSMVPAAAMVAVCSWIHPSVPVADANSATASAQVPPLMPVNGAYRVVVVYGDELKARRSAPRVVTPTSLMAAVEPRPLATNSSGTVFEDVGAGSAGVDASEHIETAVKIIAWRPDRYRRTSSSNPTDQQHLVTRRPDTKSVALTRCAVPQNGVPGVSE